MSGETNVSMGGGSYGISTWRGSDPNEKPREWHNDFFGGSKDFYGTVYTAMGIFDKKDAEKEVEGVLNILKASPGSHILDWCGGWGRHSVPLAKRGYKVTLLDFSKEYLERAEAYAAREGVSLHLVHSDFRETLPNIQADYAVNLFTAGLGYLGEENDVTALRALYAALKPGARVLIDTMSLVWLMRNFQPSSWQKSKDEGHWRLERRRLDFMTNKIHSESVYVDSQVSKTMQVNHELRVYSPADLARVLKTAGFAPRDLHGDFEGSEFTLNSKRVVMTALRLE